jgi:hypothetical protein
LKSLFHPEIIITDAFVPFALVAGITIAAITSREINATTLTRFERDTLVYIDATLSFQFVSLFAITAITSW